MSDLIPRRFPFSWSIQRPADLPKDLTTYLDAQAPSKWLPWREVPYSVLDVETTGLNPKRDSVLSIGLVNINDGRIDLSSRWYTLVKPPAGTVVSADSIRIHGLFNGDVAQARPMPDVLQELAQRLRGRVLVVHFARIDIDFLMQALHRFWHVPLRGPAIDTLRLARVIYHNDRWLTGHDGENLVTNLEGLAQQFRIPLHMKHHALGDALTTAQLFLVQATRLSTYTNGRLSDLLKAGRCLS